MGDMGLRCAAEVSNWPSKNCLIVNITSVLGNVTSNSFRSFLHDRDS